MDIQVINGKSLILDERKWIISKNPTCQINSQNDHSIEIINENGIKAEVPKEIISVNKVEASDNQLFLTESLYNRFIVEPERAQSFKKFNELFLQNKERILSNSELILSKAEYFLLKPDFLTSGSSQGGVFNYCLGDLLSTFKLEYTDQTEAKYKKEGLKLVSIKGSSLSGSCFTIYWSKKNQKLLNINSLDKVTTSSFTDTLQKLKNNLGKNQNPKIDFQHVALEQLLKEIEKKN
jgi:hypothetical protein